MQQQPPLPLTLLPTATKAATAATVATAAAPPKTKRDNLLTG